MTWKFSPPASSGRELLTAARTYYVRTDGNDANNGLANTSGGAFLTIQKAIDTVARLDLATYDVTINVANGTYTGQNELKRTVGAGAVYITGNTGTPSSCLISTTSGHCFGSGDFTPGDYRIAGFKLQTTTSGIGLFVSGGLAVSASDIEFGACATSHMSIQQYATLRLESDYSITGSAGRCWIVGRKGLLITSSRTVTLTGTPAFTQFALVSGDGYVECHNMTFSGSATGTRYLVTTMGLIATGGGGATYLPGNSAGSATAPGAYV